MPLGLGGLFPGAERGGGRPEEGYTFQRGGTIWRYASSRETLTIDGIDFPASSIKRGDLQQNKDVGGTQVVVTVPLELAVAQAIITPTGQPMTCSIQRAQTAGTPVMSMLAGDVVGTKFTGDIIEFTVATIERKFKTMIPRKRIARTCQWTLFDHACGLNKDDFDLSTTITGVSGNVITVASAGSLNMKGGMIRLPSGRILFVAAVSGLNLTVYETPPAEAVATAAVTLYPGCDKLFSTCETTFNNAKHFGGFPNLPKRNPALSTLN